MTEDRQINGKASWLLFAVQGFLFALLPWFSLFLVELLGEYEIALYLIDKGMVTLAAHAAVIYLALALLHTLLGWVLSFSMARLIPSNDGKPGRGMAMLATLALLAPLSCSFIVLLNLEPLFTSLSPWLLVPGVAVVSGFVMLCLFLFSFCFFKRPGARRSIAFALASLGILGWPFLVMRCNDLEPGFFNLVILFALALAQLGMLARTSRDREQKIPFLWMQRKVVILFLALGVPFITLVLAQFLPGTPKRADQGIASSKPNVVVLLVDTVRTDHCSVYGYSKKTTERLWEMIGTEATIFKNATSQASNTIPSVKALFTSRAASSWGLDSFSQTLPENEITLARVFQEARYDTACFSANELIRGKGFEEGFQEFLSWSGVAAARRSLAINHFLCRGDYLKRFSLVRELRAHYPEGNILMDQVDEWLHHRQVDPFFLYVHTFDPHWPYYNHDLGMIPEALRTHDGDLSYLQLMTQLKSKPHVGRLRTSPGFRNLVGRYDEELAYSDRIACRLISHLQEKGLWQNTLFVLISDHGEEFLEHDQFGHGHGVWEEIIRVPMIIKWPEGGAYTFMPESVEGRVGLIDLMPTFIDYLGLDNRGAPMEGHSLRPQLENRFDPPSHPVFSESLYRTYSFAYMEEGLKLLIKLYREESVLTIKKVFDLATDPGERNPLPGDDPRIAGILLRGSKRLEEIKRHWTDQEKRCFEAPGHGKPDLDPQLEKLKALGYVK